MTLRRPLVALVAVVAAFLVAMSFAGVVYCYFTDPELSGLNSLTAWTSSSWTVTTTTQFNAGIPNRVNTTGDEVKLNRTTGNPFAQVYALGGGGTTMFWRYDVGTDLWFTLASTLAPVGAGGALIVDGGDTLFALAGGGTRNFTMYYVSSNTWVSRANAPANVGPGGSLTYVSTSNYAYALAGGNTATFMRYSPATNTWATMNSTPVPINGGGSLTWAGGDYIYALAGGETTTFLRYSIPDNTWIVMPPIPLAVGPGGSITYEGGANLYAITGGGGTGKRDVYQYNITLMTWTKMRDTQNPVTDGAAVTWDGGPYLFVTRGGGQNSFWKYTIATDTWGNARNTPGNVGPGGSLSYVPGTGGTTCYNSPGSIASVVFDTSTADTRWDLLSWNASVPSGTAIMMEVRSSNTLFPVDDQALPWVTVTGTSQGGTRYTVPYSSLPPGRYHQWRATLSSNVCGATPILYDATVYFSNGISLITAMSGALSAMAEMVTDFSTYRGITIANPPYDPYTGAPSAIEPTPLESPAPPEATANATPTAEANATATPTANATVTPNATPALAATANVTETATPNATPTATPEAPVLREATPTWAPDANATETPVPYATADVNQTGTLTGTVSPTPTATWPVPEATPGTPFPGDTPGAATPEPTVTGTPALPALLEVAAADRNLTMFVARARETGLDLRLGDPGPFTLFAPTDDAVRTLEAEHPGLLADPGTLARVLEHHVAEGEFGSAELASMPSVRALDGADVNVTVLYPVMAIGGATVNCTDIRAGNGVIHVIDAVLLPEDLPSPTTPPTTLAATTAPSPTGAVTPLLTAAVTISTPPAPPETVTLPETTILETTAPVAEATTPWGKYHPEDRVA